jgi:hypothetical protein
VRDTGGAVGWLPRRSVAAIALLSVVLFGPGAADAHDHRRPRVVLRTAGERKVGHAYSWEWVTSDDNGGCAGVAADGIPTVPRRGLRFRAKTRVHIRFWKGQRPRFLALNAYRHVDSERTPTGSARRVGYRLRRRDWRKGGHIWIAGFHAPKYDHVYLSIFVRWRDEEDCGGTETMSIVWHLQSKASLRTRGGG